MQSPKRKVLVVDDDQNDRRLSCEFIVRQGNQALEASTADVAIDIATEQAIDAFLVSFDLQGSGGSELCRVLRELKNYEASPLILAIRNPGDLEKAFAAACDDVVQKPIDPRILQARLNSCLRRMDHFLQLSRTQSTQLHYLSKRTREIAETAARSGVLPEPQQRLVVIVFTDIREFTFLSEDTDPNALFSMISNLLAMQVDIIHEHGGYVDKFGGDGLMAVFDGVNMAVQASLCALKIMDRVRNDSIGVQKVWPIGIGIHMGRAVIGNIGSPQHLDYSVIGNTVNLAARLCGHAPPMSIVVSSAVRQAAKDRQLRFSMERQVSLRGLKQPTTVYTLGWSELSQSAESPRAVFFESLQRCKTSQEFIPDFYKRFVNSSVEVRDKFRNTDFERQNLMLLRSLELCAMATAGDPLGLRELQKRTETHDRRHLDIPPHLYNNWLKALIESARSADPEWNSGVEEAWLTILGHVINHMVSHY